MRTVVFGSQGQLGRDLCPLLEGETLQLGRADVDLADAAAIQAKIRELSPDRVVNCAAYNFVDRAEQEHAAAFAVNAWAPRAMSESCRDLDIPFLHFSTDYVFGLDADRTRPWSETDEPGPVSVYGLSKLAGEYLVRSICPKHLVIRTCGLYGVWGTGGKGGNFVETMLARAAEGKPLRVVNDQRCTPSFTADVARTAVELLNANAVGLFHVTNAGDCSWHDFANEIFKAAGVTADLTAIPSSGYPTPARRPRYSVLSNDKLSTIGIHPPRPWNEALRDYLSLRTKR